MKAYKPNESTSQSPKCIAGPEWFRSDVDTVHLKSLEYGSSKVQFRDPTYGLRHVNAWKGRPDVFGMVKYLAINREVLAYTFNTVPYASIIRHFFPSLQELIVLVDDGIDIEKVWEGTLDLTYRENFEPYERYKLPHQLYPRDAFVNASKGPFVRVSEQNLGYEAWLKVRLVRSFEVAERNYPEYVMPKISIMGCSLPKNVELPDCGRWPKGHKLGE